MPEFADAEPQKRLFLDLLTRDITLEDAILDLIDNSINSILVNEKVSLGEIFDPVLSGAYDFSAFTKYRINIDFSADHFALDDNCGGISWASAKHDVFQFGRSKKAAPDADRPTDTLSVYGIGLKRALFKLGDQISVQSHKDKPFVVAFKASAWAINNSDWKLPLRELNADAIERAHTFVEVTSLHQNIQERMIAADFYDSLAQRISETYCFFIDRFCAVFINGARVPSRPLEFGSDDGLTQAVQIASERGVEIRVVAGLAPRRDDRWITEDAGWYLFCNGRAVVFADRTKLTGWGYGMPQFVSKFRGFRGIVFFFAADPELLPWTTTKTDINEESAVFQRALNLMFNAARPVLNFLNSLYSSDEVEAEPAKAAAETVKTTPLTQVMSLKTTTFTPPVQRPPTTVSVQFRAKVEDLDRARAHLRNPNMAARRVAEIAFKYYLENEVG